VEVSILKLYKPEAIFSSCRPLDVCSRAQQPHVIWVAEPYRSGATWIFIHLTLSFQKLNIKGRKIVGGIDHQYP